MHWTLVRKTILAATLAGGLLFPIAVHIGLAAADDTPMTGQVDLSAVASSSATTATQSSDSNDASVPSDFTPVTFQAGS